MSQALTNFRASLTKVRDIIDDIDSNAALALRDSKARERYETTRCAVMVILSGFFESFLRTAAEEFVGEMCSRAVPFDVLPDRVRLAHFMEGAGVLMRQASKEKKDNPMVRSEELVRRLASVSSGPPYELIWEAFADTKSNPKPEVVREFLNRFGLEDSGKKLADKTGISQGSSDTILSSFLQLRNECAHTGSAVSVPTTTEITGYCDFFEKLAKGIDNVLIDHLNAAPFVVPPTAPAAAPPPAPASGVP